MASPQSGSIRFTTCPLCEATCGLRIEVEGERVLSIRGDREDPFSRGHICPKAVALRDIHEDPDRLRRPLRRVGDEWQEVGWEEALGEVATRMHEIRSEHGRSAFATYLGNPTVHNLGAMLFVPLFLRALESRSIFSATSVDQLPHMVAARLLFGHRLLTPVPDVDRTSFLLILGANPIASNGSMMTVPDVGKRLRAVRERGGRIVVLDPRRTETAAVADEHLFIRPGTDALFLAAVLKELLHDGGIPDHLADLCDGLDRLHEAISWITPGNGGQLHRRRGRRHSTPGRGNPRSARGRLLRAYGSLDPGIRRAVSVAPHCHQRGHRQSRPRRRRDVHPAGV
jgi:anaerobic selenocysteine-containing dehydrogenase